ncbi:endonuclease/exonuclease/phosphatase family protein [Actinomadura sp. NPDC047616]|uniref:endonuclease/exonuclease/phosphatase family protein n=1 Tax=Actinomadura sp. NPDC047616 TaxID=3155914 RepID=UPI0033E7431E
MTYNVRGVADPPPRDWRTRLPLVKRLLRKHDPDLLGVQEAKWPQMRDLERALPGHRWVGMGLRGDTRDQFLAIFYRAERFDVLDSGHFWLSDTPDVIGSATWGNRYVRMVTWVELRDRRTGVVFYQLNTHFDHESENSRTKSADLVLKKVRELEAGVPVLAAGDFNAAAGNSRPYSMLTGTDAFQDTWVTARRRGAQYKTDARWQAPVPGGRRVDWILSRGAVETLWSEIDPWQVGGVYPSDHFPVIAHLRLDVRAAS